MSSLWIIRVYCQFFINYFEFYIGTWIIMSIDLSINVTNTVYNFNMCLLTYRVPLLLGYSTEEIFGHAWYQFLHPSYLIDAAEFHKKGKQQKTCICIINSFSFHSIPSVYFFLNRVNFHSICHWRHSLSSDVSDHFFWSEYRVNRTRFHSLSSEFSLYTGVRIEWNSLLNEWNFFTP